MKIPRDLNGRELAKLLLVYGYTITRQHGSHIRLTTDQNGRHHITIPDHRPMRVGTLSSILTEVAEHLNLSKKEVSSQLFD
jgi:predicted RNA binding protein YcfA (HicA-like mRNA interferase family)